MQRKIVLLIFIMTSFSIPSYSLDLESFIARAIAGDWELKQLQISAERANLAFLRADAKERFPEFSFSSGAIRFDGAAAGLDIQAAPQFTMTLPKGFALSLSAPAAFGPSASKISPGIALSIPVFQGAKVAGDASKRAAFAVADADSALAERKRAVEKLCIEGISALSKAQAAARSAERELTLAMREFDKTVKLDGLAPGSMRRMRLERGLVEKRRTLRDEQAALKKAESELAGLAGYDPSKDGLDLYAFLPAELPKIDIEIALPEPVALPSYRAAAARLLFEKAALDAGAKKNSLTLDSALGYALGGSGLPDGLQARLGGSAALGDVAISAAGTLSPGNIPGGELSLQWKPSIRGEKELTRRETALDYAKLDAELSRLLYVAARAVADLAGRRADLLGAETDLAEDLEFARTQEDAYKAWRERDLITEAEYREASLFREECEARISMNRCARYLWRLDFEALVAPANGGQEKEILK